MKERIKSIILTLLCLSSAFLTLRTWFYDSHLIEGTRLSRNRIVLALLGFDYEPAPEEFAPEQRTLRPAVMPVTAALRLSGNFSAVRGDSAEWLWERCVPLLTDAFGTAFEPERLNLKQWSEIALSSCVYFEYPESVSLGLLMSWLNISTALEGEIITLGVCNSGGTAVLFYEDSSGRLWKQDTAARWQEQPEPENALNCAFGFELDGGMPDRQLVVTQSEEFYCYEVHPSISIERDQTLYLPFLEKLGIYPPNTPMYSEDNARVYVETPYSQCRVFYGGRIEYAGTGEADTPGGLRTADGVETARALVYSLSPLTGSAKFYLYRIEENGVEITAWFSYVINGIPVGDSAATVTIKNGAVTYALINLKSYRISDEKCFPIPIRQASALATGSGRLQLRYHVEADGVLRAGWTEREWSQE